MRKNTKFILTVVVIVIIGIVLFIYTKPFIIIKIGNIGVVYNTITGGQQRIIKPGFNLLIPIIENFTLYSVQKQTINFSGISADQKVKGHETIQANTSDGQSIVIDLSIIYKIDEEQAWLLHSEIGEGYLDKIVVPTVRTVVRNIVSKYYAIELFSSNISEIAQYLNVDIKAYENKPVGRIAVIKDIEDTLGLELKASYINVISVLMRNITFSNDYTSAIEKKQASILEAEQKLIVANANKKAKIIEAEGDAEAIRIKGQFLLLYPQVITFNYVEKITPNIQTIVTNEKAIVNFQQSTSTTGR